MRIVHLPVYDSNPYQRLLMQAQRDLGMEVINGGGGGNFMRTALGSWKADVLHFHWLHPYLLRKSGLGTMARATRFLAEVALLKQRGSRIVWTIHNLANHEGLQPVLELAFTRRFVGLVDAFIAHSPSAAEVAQKAFNIPAHKLHIVPHGNYIGVYPDTVDRATARARFGLADDQFVFLFLGRIELYKGIFDLVDAFVRLPGRCRLLIAGSPANGAVAERLENVARQDSRIAVFPAYVADEDIQYYFRAADVSVFPYRRILTSGALILAQSFGKPVIAPGLEGIRESLGEDNSWLFDTTNTGSLAATMQKALADPELEKKAARNRERAEEWPWKRVVAETMRAYGNVPVS
jgi:beta-1,4-mannosyltransferase